MQICRNNVVDKSSCELRDERRRTPITRVHNSFRNLYSGSMLIFMCRNFVFDSSRRNGILALMHKHLSLIIMNQFGFGRKWRRDEMEARQASFLQLLRCCALRNPNPRPNASRLMVENRVEHV